MGRLGKDDYGIYQDHTDKPITLKNSYLFNIYHPTNPKERFISEQSGIFGLGLESYNDKLYEKESFMFQARDQGQIDSKIVSYNITFKPDSWQDVNDSYV